jgi:hypothetical protein
MLTLMVGAYIGFRMIEVLLMSNSRYDTPKKAQVAKILATLVLVASGIACLSMLRAILPVGG